MDKNTSTYFFIGRLSPPRYCRYFNPGEIYLGNGFVLDIFNQLVCLWIPGTKKSYLEIRTEAMETLDIVITTFTFITGKKLSFSIENWVETKGVISKHNIIGYLIPPEDKLFAPPRKHKYAYAWKRAAKFYPKIEGSFYHRMALKDYKSCINTLGDDAFFYAYRIVEDIRRATTIHLPDGLKSQAYWDKMHSILRSNKKLIDPLTKVSEEIRHGNLINKTVTSARLHRKRLINIAIKIMRKEFKRSFKGLIQKQNKVL